MSATILANFRRAVRSLWADTDGVILPYVAILLVVIVGVSVLALDGARVVSLQTQLQKGADAFALAGAAELDQTADAITRANAAIDNLVTNSTLRGMGNQTVTVSSRRFLRSLPANDGTAIAAGDVTTDPALAKWVEVTVTPVSLANILPASFFGGANTLTTGAQAVAGRGDIVICGIPPVFICNPYETAGMTDAAATAALVAAMNDPAERRRQWKLNASNTGPGQFGWLVPPDGATGASALGNWIGQTQPNACYKANGVSLNTGEKQSANAGFNVRFDLYEGGSPLNSPSAAYAPSVNVRRGYIANNPNNPNYCSVVPIGSGNAYYNDATRSGLPRDTSFSGTNSERGNGQWDCLRYWNINHNAGPNSAAAPTVRADGSSGVCSDAANTTLSRYDVYRYEIGTPSLIDQWSGNGFQKFTRDDTGTGESGRPYCAGAGNGVDTTTGGSDRRIIYAAIINCLARGPFPPGSNATNVPVAGFGKFFMTQPIFADGDATRPLYGEFTGFAKLGEGVGVYAVVQLYR